MKPRREWSVTQHRRCNTERLRRGWEDAGSGASRLRAPSRPISIAAATVRRIGSHTRWPSDVFALCAVSRHWHFIVGDWTSSSPRNGAKRKRLAIFSVPASRGRARSFICNHQLNAHGPLSLRPKRNAETRDLGLKTCRVVRRETHRTAHPWSRVSVFCLQRDVKGPSALCRRL